MKNDHTDESVIDIQLIQTNTLLWSERKMSCSGSRDSLECMPFGIICCKCFYFTYVCNVFVAGGNASGLFKVKGPLLVQLLEP